MQQIADWLEQLGMSEYALRFAENDVDISVLPHLSACATGICPAKLSYRRELGLGQYEAAFRDNEIDDTVLRNLTAEDLKDLGVSIVGRKLLDAISRSAHRSDRDRISIRVGAAAHHRLWLEPPRPPRKPLGYFGRTLCFNFAVLRSLG
jgi:hypothetical protein